MPWDTRVGVSPAIASDEARAGDGPLTEELHAAVVAAEDQAKPQPSKDVCDPRAALRAGGGLLQVDTVHGLDVELNRLVFASHLILHIVVAVAPVPVFHEHPITKHDSGAIRYHVTSMIEMVSPKPGQVPMARRRRSLRRRRRPDLRALVTGVALVIAVAWTVVFGAGVVLR